MPRLIVRTTHHVVPNPEGGWDVTEGGTEGALKHFDDQKDAENWGREVSRNADSEFIVHGKDG